MHDAQRNAVERRARTSLAKLETLHGSPLHVKVSLRSGLRFELLLQFSEKPPVGSLRDDLVWCGLEYPCFTQANVLPMTGAC